MAATEPTARAKPNAAAQYLSLGLPSVELWMLPSREYSPFGTCGSLLDLVTHEAIHCLSPVTAAGPVPPHLPAIEGAMLILRKTRVILPVRDGVGRGL